MSTRGFIFLIAGPSGVGKTTLCARLLEQFGNQLVRVVTTTSRPPRPGEVDGRDYYFISPHAFEAAIQAGDFFEHAQVHGQWKGVYVREILSKLERGMDILLSVDVQGVRTFCDLEKKDPRLSGRLVTLFLCTESIVVLRERIQKRADVPESEIEHRLENARMEMEFAPLFDYLVTSADREADFAAVSEIYQRHHKNIAQTGKLWQD